MLAIHPLPLYSLAPGPHILTPLRAPRQAGRKGVGAAIPTSSNSHGAGQGRGDLPIPSTPSILSPEFPVHTPSDLDLGSGGRLSWKRFPPPWLRPLGCLRRFRGPTGRCPHLPVGISAAAERSNSRSRSLRPGGAAATAAAAHWGPLGSTALAMSGTCLRLAAVASSRAQADN